MGRWHWLAWCGCGLALAAVVFWGRSSNSRTSPGVPELPPVSDSPYLNTDRETGYSGTATCARCHPHEYESYLQTRHSRSLNDVDLASEPPDGTVEVPETRRIYTVYRAGDQLRHRQAIRAPDGELVVLADHPLRYVVGSGHLSRTYLIEAGGFLIESPISWFASQQKWALSPGYEKRDPGFARPIYYECLTCHAGNVTPSPDSDGLLTFDDLAIGCERCHGHGELHVRTHSTGKIAAEGVDSTIVNPARLDRDRAIAICAQCHLSGAAAVDLSGRRSRDFRPGLQWSDFQIVYGRESPRGTLALVGHVEQMRASRCFQASETMTCSTCHDPHSHATAGERIGNYREACLKCHQTNGCRLSEIERRAQTPQDDCTKCHMPQTPTEISHVAATHHRIGIHGPSEEVNVADDFGLLKPLVDVSHVPSIEQKRNLGLAYLQLSIKDPDPRSSNESRLRAQTLLQSVKQQLPHDGELLGALAMCSGIDDPRRSIVLAEQALMQDDLSPRGRARTIFALCDSHCKLQQSKQAIPWFEKLVKIRRQGGDWFRLAACRNLTGDVEGAAEAARVAVEIMPEEPQFRELLAEVLAKSGNSSNAREHRRIARHLRALRHAEGSVSTER